MQRLEPAIIINICCIIVSPNRLGNSANAKWLQNGITVAGGNGKGTGLNQVLNPWGLCIADDQTVYVADYSNNCIVEWKSGATSGRVVAGGNGQGNQASQLYAPTDVIIDKENDCFIICDKGNKRVVRWPRQNGTSGQTIISNVSCWSLAMDDKRYLYVADYTNHEVRRWRVGDTSGTIVAGGNGKGNRLDQLSGRFYIFVDEDYSVYVSDENNHRVMKWISGAKEGVVVAGGHGKGDSLAQLSNPEGVVVDQLGTVYVADTSNH
jgi:sugar lactone lactonase YvrE